ncbi:unnamed protein product [Rhizophagus irregularis]|uniref:DUF659 domain-containing protein n=1 Tax=Rhizophagus irregularis TaxID=588596 RepID=A0A916DXW6_9GLOM|nr:unnamed protein product [Rhizophagus irregularis]
MQSISNEDQQELEFLLARAFYSTGIPFNTIDNEDFQIFLKKACPSFKIPTCQSLSVNLLNNDYKNIRVVTKNVLNETPYFCLTSDENIAKDIKDIMIEAGINKFVAVITDNANNMKAAWRILKEKYPNKIFLGCWTHGINLWVKDIIKHNWANEILNMAKKLSLYFRNHQIPLAALRRIQKDKYRKEIGLNLPVETRLDLRYNGELLNNQRWDDIIEEELIRLVGKENQNLVLEEYILLTIKELVKNGVTIENSEEKETEDNIEILDDFEELNEMYLEQDLSKEIEEE